MRKPTKEDIELYELAKLKHLIEKVKNGEYDNNNLKIKSKLDEIKLKLKIKDR